MLFDINSGLLLIIVFQFLFLGLFLLTNKSGKRSSKILLGAFCMAIAFNMGELLITLNGGFQLVMLFSFMDLVMMLTFGPLIYLYCRSVIYKNYRLRRNHLLHFIPFFAFVILVTINYLSTSDEQKLAALEKIYTFQLTLAQAMMVVPFYLHIIIYIVLSFRQISFYKRVISEDYSNLKPYSVNWLTFLLTSFMIIALISLMLSVFPYVGLKGFIGYLLVAEIVLTFFIINRIVFKALKQPDIFSGIEEPKKYSKSNLTDEDKIYGLKTIQVYIAEAKPYLNPGLSLTELAGLLNMKEREVSQIINEQMNLSFHDFINEQRVRYATEIIKNTHDPSITILEIMYQSGFNSKSSFNAAFKKHLGQTPTEYRNSKFKIHSD